MRFEISRPALVALASTVLAVTVTPALGDGQRGQTVEIASKIIVVESSPAFHGRVQAKRDACEERRTVKMFKRKLHGGRKLLGTDVTNHRGRWQVIVDPLRPGRYFAVVTRERQGIYVCKRDKSAGVTIDPDDCRSGTPRTPSGVGDPGSTLRLLGEGGGCRGFD